MIIKNLSRHNAGGQGQLVKYIFKYIFKDQPKTRKAEATRYPYFPIPANVKWTAKDLENLRAEWMDAKIMADFRAKFPDFNIKAYVEQCIMAKYQGVENMDVLKAPFLIRHNMRGNTIEKFIKEFEKNEEGRIHKRHDQTSIHHTIISWSDKDSKHITQKMLRDMSNEYIKLRGEKNIYCGTVHTDKDHIHLHIAMSATSIDGMSARISKEAFEKDVKIKLQEFQMLRYPELSNSIVRFGKAKEMELQKGAEKNIKTSDRTSEKNLLAECIEANYGKATSTEHFISLLRESGYKEYYRNDVLTGIETEKYKYRFGRLGVDMKHLKEIGDEHARVAKDLKEIHQARGSHHREQRVLIERDNRKADMEKMEAQEQKELMELQNLRAGKESVLDIDDDRDVTPSQDQRDDTNDRGDDDIKNESRSSDTHNADNEDLDEL